MRRLWWKIRLLFGTRWVTCYTCKRRRRAWFTDYWVGAYWCKAKVSCEMARRLRAHRLERTAGGRQL